MIHAFTRHLAPINLRQLSSDNQGERFICQYCFAEFADVATHKKREEGRKKRHDSKFFRRRMKYDIHTLITTAETDSTISRCTVNARSVSQFVIFEWSRAVADRETKFRKFRCGISWFPRCEWSYARRNCRTIRNDKYAAMSLQQTLIGQTASPSKRSTSCSARWSILDDYNAPRTSYILNPPTLLSSPHPSLSYLPAFPSPSFRY